MALGTNPPRTLGDGRYVVEGVIAEGGAATVLRAVDTKHGVRRALKLLHDGGDAGRLLSEYRAMARLEHPNVLRVYEVDDEAGFIVMALAAGCVADVDLPVAPRAALAWMAQTLAALEVAHAEGVVHRDVKPDNLLLDGQGQVLLADFGIARIDRLDKRATRTGAMMGSLAFMPPEQRVDAKSVGPAADIYAAGATLFELLTGEVPMDLFIEPIDGAKLAGLPDEVRGIVWRATRAHPHERYATARAMAEAVRGAREALGDPAGKVPLAPPPSALPVPKTIGGELASTALPTIAPPDAPIRKRRAPTTVVEGPSRRLLFGALVAGMVAAGLALACASVIGSSLLGGDAASTPAGTPAPRD